MHAFVEAHSICYECCCSIAAGSKKPYSKRQKAAGTAAVHHTTPYAQAMWLMHVEALF
jgi:hypothetical protein